MEAGTQQPLLGLVPAAELGPCAGHAGMKVAVLRVVKVNILVAAKALV